MPLNDCYVAAVCGCCLSSSLDCILEWTERVYVFSRVQLSSRPVCPRLCRLAASPSLVLLCLCGCLPAFRPTPPLQKRERATATPDHRGSKQLAPPSPTSNQSSSLPPPRAAICIPLVWANLRTAATKQQQPHSWSAAVSSEQRAVLDSLLLHVVHC